MNIENPFAHAFATYWDGGWHGILHLPYGEKAAPPEGYTGRGAPEPSFADLWDQSENLGPKNIALRLPDGIIGIDVDHYGDKKGQHIIAAIAKEIGDLPPTWVSSSREDTRSGIQFFIVPKGLEFRTNLPGGVDTIQNHHRYAVVWPSVHPNGGKYYWRDPDGNVSLTPPSIDQLSELPHEWVTRLTVENNAIEKTRLDEESTRDALQQMRDGDPCRHISAAAGKALTATDRHDSYTKATLAIIGFGRDGCPGALDTIKRLETMFITETATGPNARQSTREAALEYERMITGAIAIIATHIQGVRCPDEVQEWLDGLTAVKDDTLAIPTEETELEQWISEHAKQIDWKDLWADETEEKFILYPIIPERRSLAIYSAPKVGKSLLLLEIAAAIATGREILSYTPDKARDVLYVDLENDPRSDIRTRLTLMGYTPEMLTRLHLVSFPNLAALDSPRGGAHLLAAVNYYKSDLVVIDTVSRTIEGDENENDTWLQFYRNTGLKLKQNGTAMIRLDHSGKDETKGQRGGSAKGGDVDYVWRLSRITDDTFRLECEMNRAPLPEKSLILKRHTHPHLRHTIDTGGKASVLTAHINTIITAAEQAELPLNMSRAELKKALKHLNIGTDSHAWEHAAASRKATKPNPAIDQHRQAVND
jgi:hypothetical protein